MTYCKAYGKRTEKKHVYAGYSHGYQFLDRKVSLYDQGTTRTIIAETIPKKRFIYKAGN